MQPLAANIFSFKYLLLYFILVAASGRPDHVVVSYETYAPLRDILVAHALPAITMKGINREVVPYAVEGLMGADGPRNRGLQRAMTGRDFYLAPTVSDSGASERIRRVLKQALEALERFKPRA